MGIRRRSLLGGALYGLGEGLTGLSADAVKRRQLDDQRAFEMQKLQLGELKDLQNNLASHPDQVPFFLQTASANPLLRGVDLSAYQSGAQTMGLQGLLNSLNTASSPEAIPADLGTALATRTGTPQAPMTMTSRPETAQKFGAQMDDPTLSPAMNTLANTAAARLEQLRQAQDVKTAQAGKLKEAESYGTTKGTGTATHEMFDTTLADSLKKIEAEGMPLATAAGLRHGAEIDASQEPGRARRGAEIIGMNTLSTKRSENAADLENAPFKLGTEIEKIKQTAGPLASAAGQKAYAEEKAKLKAELEAGGFTKQQQTAALQLGDDFRKESTNFNTQEASFRSILAAVKEPSAAGDLSVIFAYMKLLDPPSSVREGEQATAGNARGVPDAIRTWYNRVTTGERLTDAQRADFTKQAFALYESARTGQQRIVDDYTNRAKTLGVPPPLVVRPMDTTLKNDPTRVAKPGSTLDSLLGGGR